VTRSLDPEERTVNSEAHDDGAVNVVVRGEISTRLTIVVLSMIESK
jgi:hypothetical protein